MAEQYLYFNQGVEGDMWRGTESDLSNAEDFIQYCVKS